MKSWNRKSLSSLRAGLLAAIVLFTAAAPIPSLAQSCALCYTQAASSGSKMIQALRSGILILIIPPTIGTIGLILVVHRRTNQVRRDPDEPGNDW